MITHRFHTPKDISLKRKRRPKIRTAVCLGQRESRFEDFRDAGSIQECLLGLADKKG